MSRKDSSREALALGIDGINHDPIERKKPAAMLQLLFFDKHSFKKNRDSPS